MTRNKLWVATLVGTLGIAGIAQASPEPGEGPGPAVHKLPANVQEILDRRTQDFARADTNGDGQLDVDELSTALARLRTERQLRRLDANGDGTISADEFNGPARRRLAFMDRNGDGQITLDEMRHAWHERREHREDHGREDHHRGGDDDGGSW